LGFEKILGEVAQFMDFLLQLVVVFFSVGLLSHVALVGRGTLGLLGAIKAPMTVVALVTGRKQHMTGTNIVVIEGKALEVEDIADVFDLRSLLESLGEDTHMKIRFEFAQVFGLKVKSGVDQLC
jgi:hypothetical protein